MGSLFCLWLFILLLGSSLFANHAYHNLPTSARKDTHAATRPAHTHIRSLLTRSTSSLLHLPSHTPLSCETFRPKPATRIFVWSFAPMPTFCHRVEHQNDSDPPSEFTLTSIKAGIVQILSGLTSTTHITTSATDLYHPPRCAGNLLGPCYNTGPSPRLTLLYFHYFTF